jgi:hypothetical protein
MQPTPRFPFATDRREAAHIISPARIAAYGDNLAALQQCIERHSGVAARLPIIGAGPTIAAER